ncbi:MAG: FAD-binding oxidoreductase [Propionicimonas sp.]|nr:FAD-binding oxidoreductase [Propionicimonas sp.]
MTTLTRPADPSDLGRHFRGRILSATDPGYDRARTVWNAMIDRRPALIAQCGDAADVAAAVRHARQHNLEIAVRGGGHSVQGNALAEGGLVVDLRGMRDVTVDPDARTVRVEGGATIGDLDRGTQPFGLATTGGRVSTTGVGGFALGGGTGWLDRKFGLACDNLVSVELVTAAGEQVVASEREHPELFWALHGGGGNFGVATALTFRLYELATVTAALMVCEPESGPEVVRVFRDLLTDASDDVGGGVMYATGPEEEFVPEQLHGRLSLLVLVVVAGGRDVALPQLRALLDLRPVGIMVEELPYADFQCMLDDPPGHRNYWSAEHLSSLPDAAVDAFHGAVAPMIVPSASQHVLFAAGGAAGRESSDYPVPWRRAPWVVHPFALWTDPADDDRARRWAREVRAAVKPWATGDIYLNFITDEGADRVRAGYGPAWPRLAAVKREWDPDNVFHLNHNVTPA